MQRKDLEADNFENTDPVRARLKWFNGPKGFGFLVPENTEIDAFVHITTLQKAGVTSLGEGAWMLCHVDYGPKGAMVREVIEMIDEGIAPAPVPSAEEMPEDKSEENIVDMNGTVKWYKPEKGFGFIVPEDGKKDVFIHQSCLDRMGIEDLEPGKAVTMSVRIVPKGREVVEFDFVD